MISKHEILCLFICTLTLACERAYSTVDENFSTIMLDYHNQVRGLCSADTKTLAWNPDLADYAGAYAETLANQNNCGLSHSYGGHNSYTDKSAGENLAMYMKSSGVDAATGAVKAINGWAGEGYGVGAVGDVTGHYTAMMWKNTGEVGCGYGINAEAGCMVTACNYANSAPNYLGLYDDNVLCTSPYSVDGDGVPAASVDIGDAEVAENAGELPVGTMIPAAPVQTQCFKITENDVRALYNQFETAMESCDPVRVVALYWDRSAFIPTFSNFIRDTAEKKLEYYKDFLASNPVEKVRTDFIDVSGCNQVSYNGMYTITQDDSVSGTPKVTEARFTFTFQTFDGKYWAIKTHHSSEEPNGKSADPTDESNAEDAIVAEVSIDNSDKKAAKKMLRAEK